MKAGRKYTSKDKLDLQARRDQVMALARAGVRQRDIAKQLKISIGTVSRDIRIRLAEHIKYHGETAEVRAMTISRLEALLIKWQPQAGQDVHALRQVITLIEKIAQYSGVAPAQKMDITSDGKPIAQEPVTIQLMRPDGQIEKIPVSGPAAEVAVDAAGVSGEG